MARLSRLHNDANVLALGARITGMAVAQDCVEVFLNIAFEGGRHQTRIEKLDTGI
jgi:ribose 5-phosphate isomerase B